MGCTTADIRKKLGLTQKEFAVRFCIPLRTVQNWEQRECCPEYVHALFLGYCNYRESNIHECDE